MNDLISRREAIDAIRASAKKYTGFMEMEMYTDDDAVEAIEALPSTTPEQHGRVFQEIVVEYPLYNPYPEYKGKPYFSIKYTENGQEFIGYGTYKPEVLSEDLKEYFMPSAPPESCGDAVSRNSIVQKLNKMDRYVSTELRLCDTDKIFPRNEVFIVDDVYEEIVEQLPSAQSEIIYCGECKHMMSNGKCRQFADSTIRPSASDFCSAGERKDNG